MMRPGRSWWLATISVWCASRMLTTRSRPARCWSGRWQFAVNGSTVWELSLHSPTALPRAHSCLPKRIPCDVADGTRSPSGLHWRARSGAVPASALRPLHLHGRLLSGSALTLVELFPAGPALVARRRYRGAAGHLAHADASGDALLVHDAACAAARHLHGVAADTEPVGAGSR